MVKLAKWGAVAGLGKGMVQNAETAVDRENKILDEQRDTRLEDLRNKNAIKRDLVRSKEDRKNTELEITGRADQQAALITSNEEQGALERTSKEAQTGTRAAATVRAAEINAGVKADKAGDWTRTTAKGGSEIDISTGMTVVTPDRNLIYDPDTLSTYTEYKGDAIAQGFNVTDFEKPKNWKALEKSLFKNPEGRYIFKDRYGYLPMPFLEKLKRERKNASKP